MKRKVFFLVVAAFAIALTSQPLNSQSTCQGIYHDGVADNSWFGDAWDDIWNLDWKAGAKVCYSEMSASLKDGSVKLVAAQEVAGCSGGDGSCCEALCSSGGGAWSIA